MSAGRSIAGRIPWVVRGRIPHNESGPRSITSVRQVRADHYRKSSFRPGFERLVEGVGPSDEPSFLDRAKARWRTKERSAR